MLSTTAVAWSVALTAALIAAATDLWKYRIYNLLSWPLLLSGLIYHSVAGGGNGGAAALVGLLVGMVPFLLLYLIGGMGAGDVKLMAGLGAWLGPALTLQVVLISWLAAGVYALGIIGASALLGRRGVAALQLQNLMPTTDDNRIVQAVAEPSRRRRLIPFGLLILIGCVVTFLTGGKFL